MAKTKYVEYEERKREVVIACLKDFSGKKKIRRNNLLSKVFHDDKTLEKFYEFLALREERPFLIPEIVIHNRLFKREVRTVQDFIDGCRGIIMIGQ